MKNNINEEKTKDLVLAAEHYARHWENVEEKANIMNAFFHGHKFANEGDYVMVPKSELLKLEESRKQLYDLLDEQCKNTWFLIDLHSITEQIFKVANKRKWK